MHPGQHYAQDAVPEYRWRLRASNGRVISQSSEGYIEPRDLVRGLELSMPGWRLLHTAWAGFEMQQFGADPIPVIVPDGTDHLWHARRKR
jgi:hypothetical protein